MSAPPTPTIWTFVGFSLKWNLLLILLLGLCLLLAQSAHPLTLLLPLVFYGVFFWRDAARLSHTMRGRIVSRVNGERPRNFRRMIASTVVAAAVWYLLVFYGGFVLVAILAVAVVANLLTPLAIRRGWFAEGRIAARFHRPRFVDERFRGSVDPTGKA